MRHHKGLLFLFGLLLMGTLTQAQLVWPTESLEHDGETRTYRVFVPRGTPNDAQLPVVLVLHGGGGDGRGIARLVDFHGLGQKEDFITVYPDGINNTWNDGRIPQNRRLHDRLAVDDVGFLNRLLDTVLADYPADPQRVYVTGISNGGFMALRLACDLADRIAAVAPVTASNAVDTACEPSQPVGVLVMNGTDDPLVPYEGGQVNNNRGDIDSTDATIEFWRQHNGCHATPEVVSLDEVDDPTSVVISTYPHCDDDVQTVLVSVVGGGHTWPGASQYAPRFLIGEVSQEFDGTEVIWDFFENQLRTPPE